MFLWSTCIWYLTGLAYIGEIFINMPITDIGSTEPIYRPISKLYSTAFSRSNVMEQDLGLNYCCGFEPGFDTPATVLFL